MGKADLLACIYQEHRDAEKSLLFWTRQRKLKANSEFSTIVEQRIKTAKANLNELRKAEEELRDA